MQPGSSSQTAAPKDSTATKLPDPHKRPRETRLYFKWNHQDLEDIQAQKDKIHNIPKWARLKDGYTSEILAYDSMPDLSWPPQDTARAWDALPAQARVLQHG